ncbi:MAG: hypothetical protein NZ957_06270 [Thaumarchaeota archaeon]|nr:hypothetical protein [Candidatus Calditenuaceae archaeon]MDW8042565.1 hypothetical protein [Nitrososphaerota archaeon]
MEAVVDAAIGISLFALVAGLLVFSALSGVSSYLSYTEDAAVRIESRAVLNLLKSLVSRSSREVYLLNPNYVGDPSHNFRGIRVDFVARISFTQKVVQTGGGLALSFPSDYTSCNIGDGGSIIVTPYSVSVKGLRIDPSLVAYEGGNVVKVSQDARLCFYGGSSEVNAGYEVVPRIFESPVVVYTGSSYHVVPAVYPDLVIAYIKDRFVEPSRVKIPPDAVYLSETTVSDNGVTLSIELWAWSGGAS